MTIRFLQLCQCDNCKVKDMNDDGNKCWRCGVGVFKRVYGGKK